VGTDANGQDRDLVAKFRDARVAGACSLEEMRFANALSGEGSGTGCYEAGEPALRDGPGRLLPPAAGHRRYGTHMRRIQHVVAVAHGAPL